MICEHSRSVHIRDVPVRDDDLAVMILGHRVAIDRTPCHFGGNRNWFLCPFCERRCAVIYKKGCRLCSSGRYLSESLSPKNRRLRKAIARRAALGQTEGGIMRPFPPRPKWMRQTKYDRLKLAGLVDEAMILREFAIESDALKKRYL